MNANTITLGEVRLSYCNLFQSKPPFNNPQGDPKFSTTVLLPKTNTAAKAAIDAAVAAAIDVGVAKKWGGVRPPMIPICVHDGDGPRPSDSQPFGAECRGMWVFTASCKPDRPPFVVDRNVQPIIQPGEIYSGVWGHVNVSFFAYNNGGKKGIGCGLNGFQKTRDDEPLGSSISAEEAFGDGAPAYTPAAAAFEQTPPAYAAPVPGYPPYAAPAPAPAPTYPQQAYGQPASPAYPQQAYGQPAPQGGVNPFTGKPM